MTQLTQAILIEEVERLREKYLTSNPEYSPKLAKKCKKLEKRLLLKESSLAQMVDIKYELIALEKDLVSHPEKNEEKILKRGMWAIVVLGSLSIFMTKTAENLSKLEQPFLYSSYQVFSFVFIAFFGTTAYFFSKALVSKGDYESINIRFLLAFLFPFIFISLVKFEDDAIVGISKIHSIIFAAGYSSEFIFALFTKIVDTAKKVINADEKGRVEDSRDKIQVEQ